MFLLIDQLARVSHPGDSLLPDCLAVKFEKDYEGLCLCSLLSKFVKFSRNTPKCSI